MTNRIQKLLFSEYSDLEDTILVESPFAETTRKGKGIRQVQIGLTPTKLVLAEYCLRAVHEVGSCRSPRTDVDIDSFELVCAYPVDCVNLSVYHHRKRQTLKASFSNSKVRFFEIGGWLEKKMHWSLWCERIKFLSPYETRTSVSETSVGSTSSGGGSLFIVRSNYIPTPTGSTLLWCHYSSQPSHRGSWKDPHLYLGPTFLDIGVNVLSLPELVKEKHSRTQICNRDLAKVLVLSGEHERLAQEAVEMWESQRQLLRKSPKTFALHSSPHLLSGLGLSRFSRSQLFSLQRKRSVSEVRPQKCDLSLLCGPGSRLPPSQLLVRTVSLEALEVPAPSPHKLLQLASRPPPPRGVEFWVSEEEQRERLEWRKTQYQSQQKHLRLLRKHSNTVISWQREVKKSSNRTRSELKREEKSKRRSSEKCELEDKQATSWDRKRFSSSSLAHQLTMIDTYLFQQITTLELGRVRKDCSSWRAPRLAALLSFSLRVSSLVATRVISPSTVKDRAVQVVKYVGVAYKCHKLQSVQSTVSVLRGLQCPAVHRLQRTWAYVRRRHASKYRRFVDLSRRYQDPRLPLYQRTVDSLCQTPPFLPCVSLLAAALLGKLPELPQVSAALYTPECSTSCQSCEMQTPAKQGPLPRSLRRFLSALSIYPSPSVQPKNSASEPLLQTLTVSEGEAQLEELAQFFAPVSESPARRLLQDIEFFLDSSQAAAKRYRIPINPRVREFLLQAPYSDMQHLFRLSLQQEDPPDNDR